MDTAQFVGETTLEMLKKGVTVHLDPANYVSEGGADCSGYFDPAEKKFVCSTGKSFWFETYAHEYGHFTQWVDGVLTEEDEDDILWDWLVGGDYTYEAVKKSVRASQDIEADNEKRTVELIKKYGLPIDVPTYIQKSNAYILFYSVVLMTRRWSDGETPTYSVPEIYGKLPNDRILEASEYRNVPKWFLDDVKERCIRVAKQGPWWVRASRRVKRALSRKTYYDPS